MLEMRKQMMIRNEHKEVTSLEVASKTAAALARSSKEGAATRGVVLSVCLSSSVAPRLSAGDVLSVCLSSSSPRKASLVGLVKLPKGDAGLAVLRPAVLSSDG
jgi:hypothetical protein